MTRTLPLVVMLVACTKEKPSDPGDEDDPNDPDDTPPPSECEDDDGCGRQEICEENACVPGDRDNSFEEATPLSLGAELAVSGVIFPAGDVDTYVYESPGAEWVSIRTVTDDEDTLDTVVSLYDADGVRQVFTDDYALPDFDVTDYDSVLYAYLPTAGSWYVTVEDRTSFFGDLVPEGFRSWTYDVFVQPAGGTTEPDAVGTPSVEIDVDGTGRVTFVGMVLDGPDDHDYAQLAFPFDDRPLEVWGQPEVGGSSARPVIRLLEQGEVVAEQPRITDGAITSAGVGDQRWISWFRSHSGSFLVEATDSAGGGPDAWVGLYVRTYEPGESQEFFGTSTYEREIEPNDDASAGQSLTRVETTSGAATIGAFRLDGEFGERGDTDFYSATGADGDSVSVKCFTDRFGSLALLDVELFSGGQSFARGTTGDDLDFYIINAPLPAGGSFDLAITQNGTATGPAQWYRCILLVGA